MSPFEPPSVSYKNRKQQGRVTVAKNETRKSPKCILHSAYATPLYLASHLLSSHRHGLWCEPCSSTTSRRSAGWCWKLTLGVNPPMCRRTTSCLPPPPPPPLPPPSMVWSISKSLPRVSRTVRSNCGACELSRLEVTCVPS